MKNMIALLLAILICTTLTGCDMTGKRGEVKFGWSPEVSVPVDSEKLSDVLLGTSPHNSLNSARYGSRSTEYTSPTYTDDLDRSLELEAALTRADKLESKVQMLQSEVAKLQDLRQRDNDAYQRLLKEKERYSYELEKLRDEAASIRELHLREKRDSELRQQQLEQELHESRKPRIRYQYPDPEQQEVPSPHVSGGVRHQKPKPARQTDVVSRYEFTPPPQPLPPVIYQTVEVIEPQPSCWVADSNYYYTQPAYYIIK